MNRRHIGSTYEENAAGYLQKQGYRILERNYRNRFGEIDLIAMDGDYLVFVEVKYRSTSGCGLPLEAVDHKKQKKILSVARYYMLTHGYPENVNCRFDVVSIMGNEISLISNAFGES